MHGTQVDLLVSVEYISYKIKINATLNGGHVLWQPAACPMIGMSHGSDGRPMAVQFVRLRCPIALTCIVPFVPCSPSGHEGLTHDLGVTIPMSRFQSRFSDREVRVDFPID